MTGFKILIALTAAFAPQAPTQPGDLQIVWIDVEGGAATLIVTPAGESILMDAGWPGFNDRDPKRIAAAAERAGVRKIDHFLASHFHTDHWGGVAALAGLIPIGKFYDAGFPAGEPRDIDPKLKKAYLKACGGASTVLKPGDTIPLKAAAGGSAIELRVVAADGRVEGEPPGAPAVRACPKHPAQPPDTSDNARSIGFLLTYGSFKFLDLGDLTWNIEHKLVCPKNLIGTVDLYQVTHHGMDISNHPALLEAIDPTVAVINNGPRKGGAAETFRRLRGLKGLKDVFQVHRNVQTGPGDNAAPEFVANDAERCDGAVVRASVEASSKRFVVEIPAKKTKREYATRP
jgi:beta-lactamase superfamily II metal-dependent hydrolase